MARLDARQRAALPDSAFAYIDSRGRRRLPINDEAHVRNALARFDQVMFEDEDARDRARDRLLKAAKRHGIVPVGFITGQIRAERESGTERSKRRRLPGGVLTLMMTDIEDSTGLVDRMGTEYGRLLTRLRRILRGAVTAGGGHVVEVRADEVFAVFRDAAAGVGSAVDIQRRLAVGDLGVDEPVRVRIGLHTGRTTKRDGNYIGLTVHTAARVCDAAHGGQVLVSEATKAAVENPDGAVSFVGKGSHQLHGLPEPSVLYQVSAAGLEAKFPRPRVRKPT